MDGDFDGTSSYKLDALAYKTPATLVAHLETGNA